MYYLEAEFGVRCYEGPHIASMVLSGVFILLFAFGLPAFIVVAMRRLEGQSRLSRWAEDIEFLTGLHQSRGSVTRLLLRGLDLLRWTGASFSIYLAFTSHL